MFINGCKSKLNDINIVEITNDGDSPMEKIHQINIEHVESNKFNANKKVLYF